MAKSLLNPQNGLSVQNSNKTEGSIRLVDKSSNTGIVDVAINEAKEADGIPIGAIVMFKGSVINLPADWAFCDGTRGTPNLIDKFVLGATFATAKKTGGYKKAQIKEHDHTAVKTPAAGGHSHSINFGKLTSTKTGNHNHTAYKGVGDNMRIQSHLFPQVKYTYGSDTRPTSSAGNHSHTFKIPAFASSTVAAHKHSVSITSTTGEKVEGNLPPYYSLAYIMKVK